MAYERLSHGVWMLHAGLEVGPGYPSASHRGMQGVITSGATFGDASFTRTVAFGRAIVWLVRCCWFCAFLSADSWSQEWRSFVVCGSSRQISRLGWRYGRIGVCAGCAAGSVRQARR